MAGSQEAVLHCSAFSNVAQPYENWTNVSNITERRRLQNRINQRKYRRKCRLGMTGSANTLSVRQYLDYASHKASMLLDSSRTRPSRRPSKGRKRMDHHSLPLSQSTSSADTSCSPTQTTADIQPYDMSPMGNTIAVSGAPQDILNVHLAVNSALEHFTGADHDTVVHDTWTCIPDSTLSSPQTADHTATSFSWQAQDFGLPLHTACSDASQFVTWSPADLLESLTADSLLSKTVSFEKMTSMLPIDDFPLTAPLYEWAH